MKITTDKHTPEERAHAMRGAGLYWVRVKEDEVMIDNEGCVHACALGVYFARPFIPTPAGEAPSLWEARIGVGPGSLAQWYERRDQAVEFCENYVTSVFLLDSQLRSS